MTAEDRLALVELVGRWSHAADGQDPDALAALLTDDTELAIADEGDVVVGKQAVVRRATAAPDGQQLRRHVRNTVVDTLDGDEATTRSYYLLTTSIDGGRPRTVATGVYADRMRRAPDGGWRIAHRHVRPDVTANEENGPVW